MSSVCLLFGYQVTEINIKEIEHDKHRHIRDVWQEVVQEDPSNKQKQGKYQHTHTRA